MRFSTFFSVLLITLIYSCSQDQGSNALDQINENVSAYFFLTDSVELETVILDTLSKDDLEEMMEQVNKNLNLIDRDLDTLSLMIDNQVYSAMYLGQELEKKLILNRNDLEDSLQRTSIRKLEYQLKQAQLTAKKQIYKQTNRLLLHLKRSESEGIAGYNVAVKYHINNELTEVELLLDANYVVVD